MALYSYKTSLALGITLCSMVVLLSFTAQVAAAGRHVPTATADKKVGKDWFGHEGTVLIPGIGRYMIGSHKRPDFTNFDHSGPAAARGKYLPGNDDTFVPNPGFEVPNPAP